MIKIPHIVAKLSSKILMLLACILIAPLQAQTDVELLKKQVWEAELAFAKTMADRDHNAFIAFVAEDAVFMGGGSKVNRGKQMVASSWAHLFQNAKAPFAWKPERVEVLDNGTLALSTGPVWGDKGRFHTYTSIWRRESDNSWKVIFDKGDRYCPPTKKK